MGALERFIEWFRGYEFEDRNHRLPPKLRIQYHGRSDIHSQVLGRFIMEDLLDACTLLRSQAADGDVVYSINHRHTWSNGKSKTLDLVIGVPAIHRGKPLGPRIHRFQSPGRNNQRPEESLRRLLVACEEKAVMTEHGKSQPRIFSELNDSHTMVHEGSADTIAAGISMVNIASSFISATRQFPDRPIEYSSHDQPRVADNIIRHLRGLPQRDIAEGVGLEAYCTFVVDADNQGTVDLHTGPPAPQIGDRDYYGTFVRRITSAYESRFSDLSQPAERPPSIDELAETARERPHILRETEEWLKSKGADADALGAVIRRLLEDP